MTVLRASLDSLGQLLSVRKDQVEDALASERLARRQLDRRGFLRGVGVAAVAVMTPQAIDQALTKGIVTVEKPLVIAEPFIPPIYMSLMFNMHLMRSMAWMAMYTRSDGSVITSGPEDSPRTLTDPEG